MLEFTSDQNRNYLLTIIGFIVIYLLIYSKKGACKNIKGYMEAIKSCFIYAVVGIFLIVGIGIIKQITLQGSAYVGLIVPLGWFLITYFVLKTRLKNDFDLDICLFKMDPIRKNIVFNIFVRCIVGVGFIFTSYMIFFIAVPDTANQPYGPIPLIVAGALFGGTAVLLLISAFRLFKTLRK